MSTSTTAGKDGGNEGLRAGSPSVAVAIVTYNSAGVLPGLLDSLEEGLAGIARTKIIVVDNQSRDNSVSIAKAHPIVTSVVETGRNGGYAAGINAAAAEIEPDDYLFILNPDIRLLPNSAKRLLDCLADERIGIAVPKNLLEDRRLDCSLRRDPSLGAVWAEALLGGRRARRMGLGEIIEDESAYVSRHDVAWATGAVLLISPSTRATVGNWDEAFFLYSEEVDYFDRTRRAGLRVTYVPDSEVVHFGGESNDNPYLAALLAGNRIRYYRRHHGPVATFLFRSAILCGALLRAATGPTHRAVFRTALTIPAVIAPRIPR